MSSRTRKFLLMPTRIRADKLLVERGLFESRAKAQEAIAAGLVTANALPVQKPSDPIAADAVLRAKPAHPYVSRGGVKLSAALDHFGFDPAGRAAIDVGASTGGFTEALLARGARRVYAVDVGEAQLHGRLRERPEVISFENTDIRKLEPGDLSELPDVATVDVSFISLELVLPPLFRLMRNPAWLVALIKPQFEAGPRAGKKGVIRDTRIHAAVCDRLAQFVVASGWTVDGVIPSPIAGGDGNREFLLAAHRGRHARARTRASIPLRKKLDRRVKPGDDD
jgi:23S rRNA (cytidine1920-2'-O)/16S rRNA (cytidine1409-2'-O)-methyltransferase